MIIAAFAVLALAAAAVPPLTEIPAPSRHFADTYRGYSIEIPKNLVGCVNEDGADHGVAILLNRDARCADIDREPRVDIYADYNMPSGADTPERKAQIYCPDPTAREVVFLRGWVLGGRKASGCRLYFEQGKIVVDIFTLRESGTRDPAGWFEIGATLTTTKSRYRRDMRAFRRLVRKVRIAPDLPTPPASASGSR